MGATDMRQTKLGNTSMKTGREVRLEQAIKYLLWALDKQWYVGQSPGSYRYSSNVEAAMQQCRELTLPPPDPPTNNPADQAHVKDPT